jgi:hypothetical protein
MPIRFFIVSFLIFLGGVLSIPAAIAVWQERQIQDEDRFVETTNEVFENEEVQHLVATRLTEFIMTRADLRGAIREGVANLEERAGEDAPPALAFLDGPLTQLAENTVFNLCLRFLESQPFAEIRETALRGVHRAFMAIVKEDVPLIEENNGQVVINLRPLVVQVVTELAGARGEAALSKLDVPEDAGIIVLTEEQDHPWIWRIIRWLDDFNPVIPIISALVFLLAIIIAKSKRRAIMGIGATLAVVAGLMLLALAVPVKELATTWPPRPEGQEAAKQVYDILLDNFRGQQLLVFVIGLGMVLGGAATGDRRLVQAVRSGLTRREGVDPGGLVKERAGALRLAGLVVAGAILILWPDPSSRVVLTVGIVLALYLGWIWLVASDSDAATSARKRVADGLGGSQDVPIQQGGFAGWVARNAGVLRFLGIVVAAALLLFVWDLSTGGFVLIAAGILLYLGGIEWASTAAREPLTTEDS